MIERSFNADFINSVINHPSVREGAGVLLPVDVSDFVANPFNFLLQNEFGGFLVINVMPGIYECHTQFLPEGRGEQVIEAVGEAMLYMFTKTDCTRIITKAHIENAPAKKLSNLFFEKRGQTGDYFYYETDFWSWARKSKECKKAGEDFHSLVEDSTNHEDDEAHDYQVGAAVLTAKENIKKAQMAYNNWAVMSGYEMMNIETLTPPVVRLGDMRLTINNGEVKLCL